MKVIATNTSYLANLAHFEPFSVPANLKQEFPKKVKIVTLQRYLKYSTCNQIPEKSNNGCEAS